VARRRTENAEGYARLSELGISTVIDLRAERLPASMLAIPGRAELTVLRAARPGRSRTLPAQVERFMAAVRGA
jgi:hypothetical protein